MKQSIFFIALLLLSHSMQGQDAKVLSSLQQKYSRVEYDSQKDVYKVYDGSHNGYCDAAGKTIIEPGTYWWCDILYSYSTRKVLGYSVKDFDKHAGFCDASGTLQIRPTVFTSMILKEEAGEIVGFYVRNSEYQGYIDQNGNVIVNPDRYTDVFPFYESYGLPHPVLKGFEVGIGKYKGYMNVVGQIVIPPEQYTSLRASYSSFGNRDLQCFYVGIGDKKGACDVNGKELVHPDKYTDIFVSTNSETNAIQYIKVNIGDKVGACDAKGKEVIAPGKYSDVYYYKGFYSVEIDGKKGLCDSLGRELLECKYQSARGYRVEEGVYCVVQDGKKWKLIDENKKTIAQYDKLGGISEGLCAAMKKGKWGFVSITDGSVVIPFQYETVVPFDNGVAQVVKDGVTDIIPNPLYKGGQNAGHAKNQGRAVSTYPAPDSEVDRNIPKGTKADANTHAFIIANENYPTAKVPYALNDGWMFEKYCKQALGIKEENVHLFEDATGGNIMACVEQMKQVAKAAGGNATLIFYYAGHAFPDEEKSTAYLLPVDGDSKNPATGYSLEKLYKELNSVQTKQVVCFLDACFSGATRDDQMLIAGRGVAIKVKDEIPQGNMVVMTSATGAETAHSYEEMHHGLFTYFLLEKLQQTGGDVTLGELSEHVTKMVKRKSVLINQKRQTPTVIPSPQQQGTWQSIKL